MRRVILAPIILCTTGTTFEQTFDLGSRNILNFKYNYNEKLSVFSKGK
jgi:hypothetical protein